LKERPPLLAVGKRLAVAFLCFLQDMPKMREILKVPVWSCQLGKINRLGFSRVAKMAALAPTGMRDIFPASFLTRRSLVRC